MARASTPAVPPLFWAENGPVVLLAVIAVIGIFSLVYSTSQNSGGLAQSPPVAICGNNIKEAGELCDGTDLASSTCTTFGYSAGMLSCDKCNFEYDQCI